MIPGIRLVLSALAVLLVLAVGAQTGTAAGGDSPGPETAAAPQPERWSPGVASARRYAQRRAGAVSFQIIDLQGRARGRHARRSAPMASVFKVMLLAAYLRRPSVARHRLHGADRRLLAPMIRRSDNVAATRVRDIVGVGAIRRLARRARMSRFRYHPTWGLSRSSPRDQARFMLRLDRLIPARHRSYAKRQLARIVRGQRWGIGQVRLPGWRVYFKGGWGSGTGAVDHQVALIQSGHRRVAVAIFTQGNPSHGYGKQTLEGVARRLLRGLPPGREERSQASDALPQQSG